MGQPSDAVTGVPFFARAKEGTGGGKRKDIRKPIENEPKDDFNLIGLVVPGGSISMTVFYVPFLLSLSVSFPARAIGGRRKKETGRTRGATNRHAIPR